VVHSQDTAVAAAAMRGSGRSHNVTGGAVFLKADVCFEGNRYLIDLPGDVF